MNEPTLSDYPATLLNRLASAGPMPLLVSSS